MQYTTVIYRFRFSIIIISHLNAKAHVRLPLSPYFSIAALQSGDSNLFTIQPYQCRIQ